MGKLKGILPVEGTIGNLTFAQTESGIVVKGKSSLKGNRIKHETAFERTREQNLEFTRVAKAGKLIRSAIGPTLWDTRDTCFRGRLVRRLGKVLKSDSFHGRGERTVDDGNLRMLEGFEFSTTAQVSQQLLQKYSLTTDQQTGEVSWTLGSFYPDAALDLPVGTGFFRIILFASSIDFSTGAFHSEHTTSDFIPNSHLLQGPLTLSVTAGWLPGQPLLVGLGIECFERVQGYYCPLEKGKHKAMGIVRVVV